MAESQAHPALTGIRNTGNVPSNPRNTGNVPSNPQQSAKTVKSLWKTYDRVVYYRPVKAAAR